MESKIWRKPLKRRDVKGEYWAFLNRYRILMALAVMGILFDKIITATIGNPLNESSIFLCFFYSITNNWALANLLSGIGHIITFLGILFWIYLFQVKKGGQIIMISLTALCFFGGSTWIHPTFDIIFKCTIGFTWVVFSYVVATRLYYIVKMENWQLGLTNRS